MNANNQCSNNLLKKIKKYNKLEKNYKDKIYQNLDSIQNFLENYLENNIFEIQIKLKNTPTNNNTNSENNNTSTSNIKTKNFDEKKNIELIETHNNINNNYNNTNVNNINNNNSNINNNSNSSNSSINNNSNNSNNSNIINNNYDNNNDNNNNNTLTFTDNNILLISEIKGKVYLPYKISDLEKKIGKKAKKEDLEKLIKQEYIIPIKNYKNPIFSRFKEAFDLMKYKEKSTTLQAISLASELATNSLLNPAIISACKNLNELNIYLNYLNNNELDNFKIFEIKYEMFPAKI